MRPPKNPLQSNQAVITSDKRVSQQDQPSEKGGGRNDKGDHKTASSTLSFSERCRRYTVVVVVHASVGTSSLEACVERKEWAWVGFRKRGKPSLQVSNAGSANDMTKQRKKDRPEANKVDSPGDGMGNETFEGRTTRQSPIPRDQEPAQEQAYGCLKESRMVSKRIITGMAGGSVLRLAGLDALLHHRD